MSARIRIVDYDSRWPSIFQLEAERIRSILGSRALFIEHTGSTSVPGLAAKPVIDIVLVVVNSASESDYLPALEEAGSRLRIREPEWHEHRMLNGPGNEINLHVFSDRCEEIERMLAFRDWLRTNQTDRERYEAVKRGLAGQDWNDIQNYADAKTDVIQQIMARARHAGRS